MTIESLKVKLGNHTGSNACDILIHLKDQDGNLIANLDDEKKKLGFYSPTDGCSLSIIDTNPHSVSTNGWLEDISKVQKYVMSDADYDRREDSYRAYKAEKLKTDPTWCAAKELCQRRGIPFNDKKNITDEFQHEFIDSIKANDRCLVIIGERRGTVRYVGKCQELPKGYWVGIEYDEPVGKNDGSIKGSKYFDAAKGFGGFVRPSGVQVGDYPRLSDGLFSSDDEV